MKKSILIITLAFVLNLTLLGYADNFKVVTLGNDLRDDQRQKMLDIFNVTEDDAEIITITNQEERSYLSGIAPESQIGSRAISSAYVEPLPEGSGLDVKTLNLTWVTEDMISNALITAGINDAKVIAAAPFKVSGTAALTGIIKGFEKATGKKLDSNAKEAANREIITTGELGEIVGKDKAVQFINDIKKEVVENKITNPDDIRTIIRKIANHYDINLSEDQINKIVDLMKRISGLNLDVTTISNQIKNIGNKLSNVIENNDEVKSIIGKLLELIKSILKRINITV
ncbi:Uncharacterized protein YpuA, DUF1002 family [Alkalithermobacter thermoalcaliphilus JW-YL-7 = DSM 7308]|uniref:Uncharacterized protein YpuA, DUF1002 family n=1 Tax=Alkalithermobacter thermoalcaliphilus JW-YL-7 = DSM 7308 TaxID=1121328 RepID=A0A150FQE9_CLOPD|nr:protein of unknown function DUF1002 [[Clostridium] paradoxum JW-YL-7 = DSM 7308]SHK81000.1 Uncharacterized protein YpuA, DUF1002 family [[Clostridium] paradoxum JW-YL-7 = DSM 7308]